jgi:hypothetical protein
VGKVASIFMPVFIPGRGADIQRCYLADLAARHVRGLVAPSILCNI